MNPYRTPDAGACNCQRFQDALVKHAQRKIRDERRDARLAMAVWFATGFALGVYVALVLSGHG